ncbi:ABC transporter ATP-binding protein [Flavilitoribacter nigricans]|uniref:ATP-binding protein n=1 Tax=Flavilitoribacter nigricans (strain ATCC 23147 / DSM 23189 / NBRC 102662 / NCIMB 1420 / SS-2) TaxID=1122177 RepID=A0A2D0N1J0_FLAN2|nr:ABC transporter ATP-binding protein [Flavilitoribacter nigricans]PHN02300.1 ATP-binding protein [Flavilitoribacter nigricans DSM 23189 = NBRC 102662]
MINVDALTYTYPGNTEPTLKGLQFSIPRGSIFGFLGPSGAGKSTAQRILYKILPGFSGEVNVNGKPLADWGREYFAGIGVGFELPNHYLKLSGRENLDLFASMYEGVTIRDRDELFAMVDLQDAADKPVETYSKGMKMRLNFIRAIQHDPDILFFDEPTSGLDPINAGKINQHILDLRARGKTIFITTHNMNTADKLCDTVSFLADGEIKATDSPENLRKNYGKEAVRVTLESGESREFALPQLGFNEQFSDFLKQGTVRNIATLDASLDEVFIAVTGKSLQP